LFARRRISLTALPDGAKPVIDDRDFTIATLLAPKTAEEIEAEEAAEGEADAAAAEGEDGAEGEAADGGDAPAEGEEAKEGGDE